MDTIKLFQIHRYGYHIIRETQLRLVSEYLVSTKHPLYQPPPPPLPIHTSLCSATLAALLTPPVGTTPPTPSISAVKREADGNPA